MTILVFLSMEQTKGISDYLQTNAFLPRSSRDGGEIQVLTHDVGMSVYV